jgi:hypothetical protein
VKTVLLPVIGKPNSAMRIVEDPQKDGRISDGRVLGQPTPSR